MHNLGNTLVNFLAGRQWSPELNQLWLQATIAGRQVVFLASDPRVTQNVWNGGRYNGGYTVFWVESQTLLSAGYTIRGPWMMPPM
jgi:hypothetical protein